MTPDQCRAQAAALRTQARASNDPQVSEQLMLMVADWEKLARDAEELERRQRQSGA